MPGLKVVNEDISEHAFIQVRVQKMYSTIRWSEQARQFRILYSYKRVLRNDEEREKKKGEEAGVSADPATMAT